LGRVLPAVEKAPLLTIAIFMVIFAACVLGATRVKIDSNMVEAFKQGSTLKTNYNVVDKYMAGTNTMEIFIDGGKSDALLDPRIISAMDRLQQTIETKYPHLTARTFSLANIVKDAYQVLNDGDKNYYRVPKTPALLTQTLFMFNNANPEDRRRLVSDNYRKTHISVQLYNAGSHRYTAFFNEVKKDIDAAFFSVRKEHPQFRAHITGSLALIMKLADYIGWSQIKSLGTVIAIISLIMVFIFGSTRVGGLSIIPNLIPATLIFGLLGFLGIALDADTMIIAPVIIGIAVDDTIHFITHYREEVIKDGDIKRSIHETIHEVGQAIIFTSLVLGFGFLTLAFSSNTSFIKVGIFGSMAIFAALLCDLFLLPALILVFKPKFSARARKLTLTTNEA
jgi:predicted RND superfamily exporter protein